MADLQFKMVINFFTC